MFRELHAPDAGSRARALLAGGLVMLCTGTSQPAGCASELPDPTRPPVTHEVAIRRLNLDTPLAFSVSAIKIAGASRKAIVNNELLGVGDQIGDARVVEITPGSVVLDYLSERVQVNLLSDRVRRTLRTSGSKVR